jgi:hypothetical protein
MASRVDPDPGSYDLAARLDLLQLEAEYARTWDTQDARGWSGCFTPDGAFEMGSTAESPSKRFAGAGELEAFCRHGSGRYEGIHLRSPPALTIDGDHARGWVHFSYFDRDRKTDHIRQVVGVYAVSYARTDAGWKMALRREQAVYSTLNSAATFHGFPTAERMWADDLS